MSNQRDERSITFQGRAGGDCECFCWRGVPEQRRKQIVGPDIHAIDKEAGDCLDVLYPDDILRYLKAEAGIWEFQITVRKISD